MVANSPWDEGRVGTSEQPDITEIGENAIMRRPRAEQGGFELMEQLVGKSRAASEEVAAIGDSRLDIDDDHQESGVQHVFEVQVWLNGLDPEAVRVELYADGVNGGSPVRQEMKRVRELAGASGGCVYSAAVSAARSPVDYTARMIPHCDGVAIPLEDARILWRK
jgi:glycogen phosphorylase